MLLSLGSQGLKNNVLSVRPGAEDLLAGQATLKLTKVQASHSQTKLSTRTSGPKEKVEYKLWYRLFKGFL